MANFEEETARKIKQQLSSGELDNLNESEDQYAVDDELSKIKEEFAQDEENLKENASQESSASEVTETPAVASDNIDSSTDEGKTDKKKHSFLAKVFNPTVERATFHFDRKEKIRPLALIVAILSSIVCLGFFAAAIWGVVKMAPMAWSAVSAVAKLFFDEKLLVFTLGLIIILGVIVLIFVAGFCLAVMGFIVILGFMFLNFPLVSIKTLKLPKHVFAYEKDSFKNMILAYIYGAIISFLGFAMYMDKSIGFTSYLVLGAGIITILMAILLTVDIVKAKKAFRNFEDEKEKEEIIAEAKAIEEIKKQKEKNKKALKYVLNKIFRKGK